jgi:hypothetical protein
LLGAADLNDDGAADMIYISPEGQVRVLMATASRTCANFGAGTIPSGFNAMKLADFSGRGRGDILLKNPVTGEVRLMMLNAIGVALPPPSANPDDPNAACTSTTQPIASTIVSVGTVDSTWVFYAAGDYSGRGINDIVWMQQTGVLNLWRMNMNLLPTAISNVGSAPVGFVPLP